MDSYKIQGIAIVAALLTCVIVVLIPPAQPASKTRQPSFIESTAAAQQAAKDAQAAAADAKKTLEQTQQAQKETEENESRPERIGPGIITDVQLQFEGSEQSSAYESLTFQEDGGFVKRFTPMCHDQVFQTGKKVTMNYHWAGVGGHGCYKIDGYLFQ